MGTHGNIVGYNGNIMGYIPNQQENYRKITQKIG
jgi:hypothetical protein